MIKQNQKGIEKIVVSDPTQKLSSLQLTTTIPFVLKGKTGKSSWQSDKKLNVIDIELPQGGYAGSSVIVE
jgi:hypothetical protein